MTKTQQAREAKLLPAGTPRWVRVYDNGGPDAEDGSIDRYTVVFTGKYRTIGLKRGERPQCGYLYVGMSGAPFHPQGFCQHGETSWQPCDTIKTRDGGEWTWPPAIGRRCHLGKRIRFEDLPADCQRATLQDYRELWNL